jgi:hypothetical protein
MFSNSLRMFKTDRNMLELRQILYKNYFNISAIVGFIVWKDSFVSSLVSFIFCRLHQETVFENVQTRIKFYTMAGYNEKI